MNAEFIAMLDYLERERGIKREILLEAVSTALLSASKKSVGAARDLRIDIDPRTGDIRALANLVVVDEVTNPQDELALAKARRIKSDAKVGDTVEMEVTPKNFGRIAAQTAKQAMMQRIRQVEKEMIYEEFKDRAGEIVNGTVRRFDRSDVVLDLGKFEAIMPQRERVVGEDYNVGDRLRAHVVAVDEDQLSLAIGKKGQNARLTSRLTGWEINILKDTSATTVVEQKVAQAAQTLLAALPISDQQATTLVKSGFTNLEGMRDADVQDLVDVLGIDEAKAREIHEAVKEPEPAQ